MITKTGLMYAKYRAKNSVGQSVELAWSTEIYPEMGGGHFIIPTLYSNFPCFAFQCQLIS